MRKLIFVALIVWLPFQHVHSQLLTFGILGGPHYSIYSLYENNSAIRVTGGSLGFHSGLFVRRDFEIFYIGADLCYSSTLGGTITDGTSSFDLRTGSVDLPVFFGKKFYPGIRIFGGAKPAYFIKHNDTELQSFLENSPNPLASSTGTQERNDFVFHIMAGAGIELFKFFIELRYEYPLDFFILEDFSTGGTITNIDNKHYLSQFSLSIAYWFN